MRTRRRSMNGNETTDPSSGREARRPTGTLVFSSMGQCQTMNKKEAIRTHYEPRFIPGRPNYQILDWASAHSQKARFQVLVENVRLHGKSLLDVGCGLGDLWAFLKRDRIDVSYTGVDILEKMVREAQRRHPDARFLQGDVFAESPDQRLFGPESFDYVFCSGIFNLDLGNNKDFLPRAVPRLLEIASEGVVFNLLHSRTSYRDSCQDHVYAYYDPAEVLAMLLRLPCRTIILDDYLPNDFTVICQKAG